MDSVCLRGVLVKEANQLSIRVDDTLYHTPMGAHKDRIITLSYLFTDEISMVILGSVHDV